MKVKVRRTIPISVLIVMTLSIIVTIGILTSPRTYGDIIENRFKEIDSISYTLPQGSSLTFRIMDWVDIRRDQDTGKIIYEKELGEIQVFLADYYDNGLDIDKALEPVVIPETIEVGTKGEYPVVRIMSESFSGCRSSEIKIPSGVLKIENNAFTDCPNLEKITVDSNNSRYANNNQDGIIYDKDVKELICYPTGKKDTSFTIPDGIETLRSNAFEGNYNLKEVILSKSVKEVTGATFEGTRLIDIKVDEANENYSNYNNDGALYNKDISKIIVYPRGKEETTFTIPNSVTTIGYEAFVNCNKMIEIIIPKGVTTLEDKAFYGSGLENISIPESVTTIGKRVFGNCDKLTEVTIPGSIKTIGDEAFWFCNGLKKVIISKGVEVIGEGAFYNCDALTDVMIPGSVTTIGEEAFTNCTGLTEITIPEGVTTIKKRAFGCCNGLTEIVIPETVTTIEDSAFAVSYKLNKIFIPNSVTSIGVNIGINELITGNTVKSAGIVTRTNSTAHQYAIDNNLTVELDDTSPTIQSITYSTKEATNKNVKVTITADEPIKTSILDNRDWEYVPNTDKKSIIAEFSSNTTNEKLTIKDLVGNSTTATININNIDKTAPTATITTDKETYNAGETAVITATFDKAIQDSTPKISITGVSTLAETSMTKKTDKVYTYNYVVPNKTGKQTITVSGACDTVGNIMEANSTKTFNIAVALSSIKVTTSPNKTKYIETQNFDPTGMKVTATYSDGTEKEVTGYTVTDGSNLALEKTSVTISYTENGVTKTVTQAIKVVDKEFRRIEITIPPTKTEYIEGQNFSNEGMRVTVIYEAKNETEIARDLFFYEYTVTNGENLKVGQTSVTISYTDDDGITKTVEQPITVKQNSLSSIKITTAPSKTAYIEGQNFDPTGMKVTATYDNGTTKEVTGYTVTDGNNLTVGKASVTISYTENGVTKTVTQAITVKQKSLSSIKVTTEPARRIYAVADEFDTSGMKVTATYDNGTEKEVTGYTVTDGNNLTAEQTSVTISYTEGGITKTTTCAITVVKVNLKKIYIETAPAKTEYIEGQNFDATGMEIIAEYEGTYEDGRIGKADYVQDNEYIITNGNNLQVGQTSVTISYTEDGITKTVEQPITVKQKSLSSIKVTTEPTKKIYAVIEKFDTKGMKVTATYDDGTTKEVTDFIVTDGNNLTVEQTSVTISYTENGITKTTTCDIIVVKVNLNSIEIKTAPAETEYIEGQNFDDTGMEIRAMYGETYGNGGLETVKLLQHNEYTITNGNNLQVGQTSVTISYTYDGITKTVEQPIIVKQKSLSSIKVTTAPNKVKYIEGQNFDTTGMKVTATYDNGTTKEVTGYTVTDGNNLAVGKNSVTISYTENGVTKTVTQAIKVVDKEFRRIEITIPPTKTEYIEGQNFSNEGMRVTVIYEAKNETEIARDLFFYEYTVTNGENLKVGQTSVTISYTDDDGITKTVEQPITVKQNSLSSIKITTAPSKTAYIEGQNFDPTGMKVTATYDNGTTKEVTGYTVTDGNNLTIGKTSVTISYTENGVTKTVTQAITVKQKTLSSIRITTAPSKTTYMQGQNFDTTGMKVTATYDNGTEKEVTGYTVTDGNNLALGKTSVTISYTENGVTKTVTQAITVTQKLEISYEGYSEIENKYITNISPNTAIEEMLKGIKTNGTVKVYKNNKEVVNTKEVVSTGMKVEILLGNEKKELTTVVKGDTNGDGKSDLRDLLQVNKHRLNKITLKAEYLLAGDVNGDNKVDVRDLLQINKFRLGKISY